MSAVTASLSACSAFKNFASGSSSSVSCSWSVEQLAAQVVVVPADQSKLDAVKPAVQAGAGGILLFGNTPANLWAKLDSLVKNAPDGRAPVVMVDQEGGAIRRLTRGVDPLKSARWMGDHWSASDIQQAGSKLGEQMKKLGVTMNLAPVLDLDATAAAPSKVNAVGNRSFGPDPTKTAQDGVAFGKGMQAAGVTPVVKHFPGLGGTVGNTDFRAAQTLPWEQLQKAGLLPFKAAVDAGMPAVMTANASVPGLTALPASISPEVMQVLRQQLGFKGLIMTDSLSAKALSENGFPVEKAGVAALKAGADLLLYGTASTPVGEFEKMTAAIVAAVNQGQLSRDRLIQAANAVLAAKKLDRCSS